MAASLSLSQDDGWMVEEKEATARVTRQTLFDTKTMID